MGLAQGLSAAKPLGPYYGGGSGRAAQRQQEMQNNSPLPIDYKTHILVAVRRDGVMTVVCDWPHLPTQAEVQEQIDASASGYAAFALCTPTSILPVDGAGGARDKSRSGRWA
jgi:hypothetical protein